MSATFQPGDRVFVDGYALARAYKVPREWELKFRATILPYNKDSNDLGLLVVRPDVFVEPLAFNAEQLELAVKKL